MKVGKLLHLTNRKKWRVWLAKHHNKEKEIWLVYYKKHTNKLSISYNDTVEEALCYGWIDSTYKRIDEDKGAQRFTPRREKSSLSEMNRERVKRLIKEGKMTKFGLEKIKSQLERRHGPVTGIWLFSTT